MPKKGIIQCLDCGKEFEGVLPDDKQLEHLYIGGAMYGIYYKDLDEKLVDELKQHHKETYTDRDANGDKIRGHRDFKVFLEDGTIGQIEAGSYCVTFKELKETPAGKER